MSDKSVLSINTNTVLIIIVIDIKFLSNAHQDPSAKIGKGFYSQLLRCFGAVTSVASKICPQLAANP